MSGFKWSDKNVSPEERARALLDDVGSIEQEQNWREEEDLGHLRLYSEREWRALTARRRRMQAAGGTSPDPGGVAKRQLGLNVTRNIVNAASNMTGREQPLPTVTTVGMDYERQRRGRDLQRFIMGVLNENRAWQVAQDCVLKGGNIFGTAGVEVYRQYDAKGNAKIRLDPVYPFELRIRDNEAEGGVPITLRRVRHVDAEWLLARYGDDKEKAAAIRRTAGLDNADRKLPKKLRLVTGWDSPTEPGGDDGARVVAIEGGIELEFEPWERSAPPFAFYRWETEPYRFFGTGIPEELRTLQYEINSVILTVQANVRHGGHLRIFNPRGGNVPTGHFVADRRTAIIEYDGIKPTFEVTDVFSPQVLSYLQWLVAEAHRVTGVSELWAASKDPGASMSGKARAIHHQTHSLRFVNNVRRYERFFLDLAECIVDECESEYGADDGTDMSVLYAGYESAEALKWSDIRLPRDHYEMQMHTTAFLSQMPSERIQEADWMHEKGWMKKDAARNAMGIPFDLWHEEEMEMAPRKLIEKRISRIIDYGEDFAPSGEMNLDLARDLANAHLQRAECVGVKEENLDKLRKFRDEVLALIDDTKQAAASAGPGPSPAASPGPPGAPSPGVPPLPPVMPPPAPGQPLT